MPSAMCSIACKSGAYRLALANAGFSTTDTVTYGGKTYTHDDIAGMVDESYQRHRGEYAVVCGGKPRLERKRSRQLEKAVRSDVFSNFHVSWWTLALAGLVLFMSGPLGLVAAIVGALLSHYIEKDLDNDPQMMAAMGCA